MHRLLLPGAERLRSQRSVRGGQALLGRLLGDLDPSQKTAAAAAARSARGTAEEAAAPAPASTAGGYMHQVFGKIVKLSISFSTRDIILLHHLQRFGIGGGGCGGLPGAVRNAAGGEIDFPLRILVQSDMVGAIIGRGGQTIRSITQQTR